MTKPQSLSMYNAGTLLGNQPFLAGAVNSLMWARTLTNIFDTAVDMTRIDMEHGNGDYYSFLLLISSYLDKNRFDFEWVTVVDLPYHGLYIAELQINTYLTGIRIIRLTTSDAEYFDVMYALETIHNKALSERGII